MKTGGRIWLALAIVWAGNAVVGQVATPAASSAPPTSAAGSPAARSTPRHFMIQRPLPPGKITVMQSAALQAAGMKARHDPKVVAAATKYWEAMAGVLALIEAKDPVDKVGAEKVLKRMMLLGGPLPPGTARLTATDLEQYRRGLASVKGSPQDLALVGARHAYTTALLAAMRAADPSLNKIVGQMARGSAPTMGNRQPIVPRHRPIMIGSPSPVVSPSPQPGLSGTAARN